MERKLYAIVMRNTAFWVVGPFEDDDALTTWGDHEREHGDDPRWQSISLFPSEAENAMPPTWHPGYTP